MRQPPAISPTTSSCLRTFAPSSCLLTCHVFSLSDMKSTIRSVSSCLSQSPSSKWLQCTTSCLLPPQIKSPYWGRRHPTDGWWFSGLRASSTAFSFLVPQHIIIRKRVIREPQHHKFLRSCMVSFFWKKEKKKGSHNTSGRWRWLQATEIKDF